MLIVEEEEDPILQGLQKRKSLFSTKIYRIYKTHIDKVQEGEFQAYMEVELINDGPVTIIIDTEDLKTKEG